GRSSDEEGGGRWGGTSGGGARSTSRSTGMVSAPVGGGAREGPRSAINAARCTASASAEKGSQRRRTTRGAHFEPLSPGNAMPSSSMQHPRRRAIPSPGRGSSSEGIPAETGRGVVVDDAAGLHKGVGRHR